MVGVFTAQHLTTLTTVKNIPRANKYLSKTTINQCPFREKWSWNCSLWNLLQFLKKLPSWTLHLREIWLQDFCEIVQRNLWGRLFTQFGSAFFFSRPIICECINDKIPHWATIMCIYKFTCSCRAGYIGCIKQTLFKRDF